MNKRTRTILIAIPVAMLSAAAGWAVGDATREKPASKPTATVSIEAPSPFKFCTHAFRGARKHAARDDHAWFAKYYDTSVEAVAYQANRLAKLDETPQEGSRLAANLIADYCRANGAKFLPGGYYDQIHGK